MLASNIIYGMFQAKCAVSISYRLKTQIFTYSAVSHVLLFKGFTFFLYIHVRKQQFNTIKANKYCDKKISSLNSWHQYKREQKYMILDPSVDFTPHIKSAQNVCVTWKSLYISSPSWVFDC